MNDKTLIAQEIARMGRGGDTMLAHINPHEAMVLRAMGGAGTTNPYTGLPEYRIRWRNIVRAVAVVAAVVVAVYAPQLIPQIGASILETAGVVEAGTAAAVANGSVSATIAMQAAGQAAIAATSTAITGGNLEQIATSAATAVVSVGVGGNISQAVSSTLTNAGVPSAIANVAGASTGAAATAAATGGDVNQAVTNAAITSSATNAYRTVVGIPTTPPAPALTQPPSDSTTGGPADYSLTAGTTAPRQSDIMGLGGGISANLPPLPPESQIGITPIDYGNLLAPSSPSTGYQQPRLRELPPAEQIGRQPIDYGEILTPEQRNLPEMGGGSGLTVRDESGATIGLAPREEPSALKQAGEVATRLLASDYASSLSDQPSRSSSTLTSTGLFTPTSIVPTALTGIAPTARGKPILGGEDEESTGAWGAKTLRG